MNGPTQSEQIIVILQTGVFCYAQA